MKHVKQDVKKYFDKRLNRTTKYLFPLLYDGYNLIASNVTNLEQNGFTLINLFIGDDEKPEYISCIFMLLHVKDFENDNFKLFFEDVKHHVLYKEYYNVDTNYIMLVFEISEKEKDIYRYFIKGQYSKFPKYYKNIFQSGLDSPLTSAYNVITKNPLLKHKIEQDLDVKLSETAELDDKPYLDEEVFRYTTYTIVNT